MALHESVLEEFGLAPLWVRRGMAARPAVDEAGAGYSDGQGTQDDGRAEAARAAAGEPVIPGDGRNRPDDRVAAGRADEPRSVRGDAQEHAQEHARDERHVEPAAQVMREPMRASADVPPPPALSESVQQDEPAPPRRPARQPEQQSKQQSEQQRTQPQAHSPEPPNFDAPPDDDFAWFDDLPAHAPAHASPHAPAEARGDTPSLPPVHTLDWDALSERVAACESCRLCEKRRNTVFGVGDRHADWMLIGEAPGENEDRLGEPFVGQAGKLLDNMLRSLALARDTNVYIANVIKCRPPGNRNPQPDEVARCEPYLQRQVALVKPKLIVALGRFAAQSLLKTEASISSLRGRVHAYEGVPVIVTYHPAYLLRSLPDKAKAWADLCLARDTWLAGGGASSNEPT
ncbi:uracil-DNA glycosylase [Paraburkholderia susongensis]|uniref:Type-4 uracil-DNA glycosylase n=1 Tax=Paraburkholderia susongensis TaxID=1515439 RepID=A0A1X7I1Z9_9BURK|nr:uracil-DNA glycosylase [Paraburkholderia susongensis]SMG08022.1 DNA polymerase [Paraburkholderia susongensis]